ncbi:IS66 family insertion sequence element accessory protein TnpA [Shewanella indica]|uniref:IS66 family insertion sequence element accessory protein TnpA n=1 Tax=Shewanella indica TaxID=768528 RepID=UPI003C70FFB4
MNQAQKRAHWTAVIEQQKQSQLSIKQFCQANGINRHSAPNFRFKNLTAIGHSDLLLSFAGNSSWPLPLSLSVTSTTLVWSLHFAKNSALLA